MSDEVVVTVFGTRPELVKLCMVIEEMDRRFDNHVIVHTDQHYDYDMDQLFMEELEIRAPDHRLSQRSENPVEQLGAMISQLSHVYGEVKPDVVVVLGDTNSTLAGALAAKKSGVLLSHIEAGCRSHDKTMPEEQNRVVVDHISDILFAPSRIGVENLRDEGITGPSVHLVGSTLIDVCRRNLEIARSKSKVDLPERYALVTIHRAANIQDRNRLQAILDSVEIISESIPVVFPVHPHTSKMMKRWQMTPASEGLKICPPLGYLDFLKALAGAEFVLTDSGGVQQEAQVLGVPILTARKETEWVETVECGGCRLVDADAEAIIQNSLRIINDDEFRASFSRRGSPYSETEVSKKIAEILFESLQWRGTVKS
ncbi:MAG: UDP-N-acetylglucosamine 2-epimerase (non-hydrolyzing) [Methanobacteriota archaeon]|nr:MAG: UDP-N-acetylglucosamine 2-epimerase (non-hydrolyzing) [Euryarchaeota archaeon]